MLYYMLNKPASCITACRDERRPTVMPYLPDNVRDKLHPIGRLDMDTHGLLIFTDDGMLDPALMQPTHHVEKEYFFYAMGELTPDKIALLEGGVNLGGATAPVSRPASVGNVKTYRVREIEAFLPEERKKRYLRNPEGAAFSATLTIHEGKKHEVKRMLRAVGCRVVWLSRTALGGVRLDPDLPEGSARPLTDAERDALCAYKKYLPVHWKGGEPSGPDAVGGETE